MSLAPEFEAVTVTDILQREITVDEKYGGVNFGFLAELPFQSIREILGSRWFELRVTIRTNQDRL